MNVKWRTVLEPAGAVLASDQVVSFGEVETELRSALAGDICCDLSHLALIAARGADSETFLQGQLTCDLRQVTADRSRIGAYCTPKGRALACFRLFRRDDAYSLELPCSLVEPTLARLRKYVMRAKTTLEDASDATARMGVAGANAGRLLVEHGVLATAEMAADTVWQPDNLTVIRLSGSVPRFELHGPPEALATLWSKLATNAVPVGAEAWRLLDILAGTPVVYPETVEAFVPQMLNLDLLNGVNFQKGCYTGQEIVARAHYLGKLKRRMVLARVDSPALPRPGDPLFSPQADASQSAGQLADAARHPDGGHAVLAVASIEFAEQGPLQLGDANGPALRLEPLPYRFEATS
ncbi:MAG: folate-binding protein YgfZ [Candidatus Competibacteraceae bacterium]|nr:folate-binding protein YgfZ [Candidatus Competibacteraceae bacterium]